MQHKSLEIKAGIRETLPFQRLSDRAAWLLFTADHGTMSRRDAIRLISIVNREEPTLPDYLTVQKIAERVVARPYVGEEHAC